MGKRFASVILAFTLIVILTSCSQETNVYTDKKGNEYNTQEVYNTVKGINDTTLNYSVYFPQSITKKSLPVLFLLDPHANGSLPVTKYAQLANKYNYILVGSNVSRNGLSSNILQKHIKSLIAEVKSRYKVDEKSMFIGGFSGGAKLAILFAENMPEIIGAIACGGSIALTSKKEPNFYYAGIVGDKDFNYLEMRQSYTIYDQYGFDYTAEVFGGNHEWPPINSFEKGIIGFEIYRAKIKQIDVSKSWINNLKQSCFDEAEAFKSENKLLYQFETLQQANRWFYGLSSVSEIQKQLGPLTQSPKFRDQLKKKQQIVQLEVKLRMEFIKAIDNRDFTWWQTEVDKIRNSDKGSYEIILAKKRLLNYISMASFMLIKGDLEDSKFDNALNKINIYELVDPTNPDVYLMKARYFMQNNDFEGMNENYIKAKELGFKDIEVYKAELFWKPLFNNLSSIKIK